MLRKLTVTALALLTACGSDILVAPGQDDAAKAVTLFTQLSDSVARSGGDSAIGNAYAGLAEAVRRGGRISTVLITIDGVPTKFSATAIQSEISAPPCTGDVCPAILRRALRSLIAWQQDDPRRIVQLSSESDADPIRAYLFPVLVPYAGASASLTFFDGKGGAFFGTSGTQKVGITTSETACAPAGPDRPVIAIFPAPPRCTKADFVVAFDGKAEPSTFLAARNNATGSHTLSMASQPVLGARFEMTAPDLPKPPIDLAPTVGLPATITVTTDTLVTLTLTISNPGASAVQVVHPSSQRYEFVIADGTTGLPVWKWSDGQGFFQALTSETIAAGGRLTYTASWKPTRKGAFIATGELVSISHRAGARASFSVP
jgi:hypothetical protein